MSVPLAIVITGLAIAATIGPPDWRQVAQGLAWPVRLYRRLRRRP